MMDLHLIVAVIFLLARTQAFPCPKECICKSNEIDSSNAIRMSYLMNCTDAIFADEKLHFTADASLINEIHMHDDPDDEIHNDYIITLDLSNSLENFNENSVELKNFSFFVHTLTLTSRDQRLSIDENAFRSPLYRNLHALNLSNCCEKIPENCSQLFSPLNDLQSLDLSSSDFYSACLGKEGSISSRLNDLYLRDNIYDADLFSNANRLFDGVRRISGRLDLRNSLFKYDDRWMKNCIFDLFQLVTILDLSDVRFEPSSEDRSIDLARLIKCEKKQKEQEEEEEEENNGEQLLSLSLAGWSLTSLPKWFNAQHFPRLTTLDLSRNHLRHLNIESFIVLQRISLAFNPIDMKNISWKIIPDYSSINLRSTSENENVRLQDRIEFLLGISSTIDYSENQSMNKSEIVNLRYRRKFLSDRSSLNLSRTGLQTFRSIPSDLDQLDLSWNYLTELNLSEQKKLTYLDCSNQNLKKLILNRKLIELRQLKCSNNSLTNLENFPMINNGKLRLIDLSNNLIESLERIFFNLTSRHLHTVKLQYNRIQAIRSNTFHSKLFSLYELDLSWNRIDLIERNAINSPNLQILHLTGNSLRNVQPESIVPSTLRLFFLVQMNETVNERCENSQMSSHFLSIYTKWFQENSSYMKTHASESVQLDSCTNQTLSAKKTPSAVPKKNKLLNAYLFYLSLASLLVLIFFVVLHLYRTKHLSIGNYFQRYKRLDRNQLVENAEEGDRNVGEDDEIVMNLQEPPFNKRISSSTKV